MNRKRNLFTGQEERGRMFFATYFAAFFSYITFVIIIFLSSVGMILFLTYLKNAAELNKNNENWIWMAKSVAVAFVTRFVSALLKRYAFKCMANWLTTIECPRTQSAFMASTATKIVALSLFIDLAYFYFTIYFKSYYFDMPDDRWTDRGLLSPLVRKLFSPCQDGKLFHCKSRADIVLYSYVFLFQTRAFTISRKPT